MIDDADDQVELLRQRFAALADGDATALGQVEWQSRRLAQRHGNNVEARALHIAVLARLGRRADGIAALEAAVPLLPWVTTPLTALRMAGSALGFGRAELATALVRRMLTRGEPPPAAALPLLALVPLVAGDVALLREVADGTAKQDAAAAPAMAYVILARADLLDRLADHQRFVLGRVGRELCEVRLGLEGTDSAEGGTIVLDYRLTVDPASRSPTVVALASAPLSPRLVERFGKVPALAHLPQNEG